MSCVMFYPLSRQDSFVSYHTTVRVIYESTCRMQPEGFEPGLRLAVVSSKFQGQHLDGMVLMDVQGIF